MTGVGTTTLAYDYKGRVTTITYPSTATNTFSYNGLDTRVGKVDSGGTSTYMRDGADVLAPVLNDGAATYTPAISERRSSTTTYYHGGIKNAETQTVANETVSATVTFDAFGNLDTSSGTFKGPFGYGGPHGYQSDADSGLKLLGHRYYDSSTGRFLTRDPAKDGRNWYGYCEGRATALIDDGGLKPRIPPHHMQALMQYIKQGSPDIFLDYVEEFLGIPVPEEVKDIFNNIRPGKVFKKPGGLIEHVVEHIDKANGIINKGGNANSVLREIKAAARKMYGAKK